MSVDRALALALADELARVSAITADLAGTLAGDADILRRHMVALQAIDRIAQTQFTIAQVLRATGPAAERFAELGLEDVAERLGTAYQAHREAA